MSELSSSPDRYTFQLNNYVTRMTEAGRLEDPHVQRMIKFYQDWAVRAAEAEADPAWRQNNLEYDLRSTDWIIDKCRSDAYAQNLYAALCNMQWQKRDVMPILKDEYWSCSWRSAGGIVADIQGKGDYIDWYCSGIRNTNLDEEDNKEWDGRGYVPEGTVTEEIENDMYVLGWIHCPYPEDQL